MLFYIYKFFCKGTQGRRLQMHFFQEKVPTTLDSWKHFDQNIRLAKLN